MDLISEFFYEIRRFIPGLTVIALYFHKETVTEFNVHRDFSIVVLVAFVLTLAWLLGLVIEEFMCCFAQLGWKLGGGAVLKWLQERVRIKKWETAENTRENVTPESKDRDIRLSQLEYAERETCRSLWPIFLFAWICPPESFAVFPWKPIFAPIGAFAFGFGWLWPIIQNRVRAYKLPPETKPESGPQSEPASRQSPSLTGSAAVSQPENGSKN